MFYSTRPRFVVFSLNWHSLCCALCLIPGVFKGFIAVFFGAIFWALLAKQFLGQRQLWVIGRSWRPIAGRTSPSLTFCFFFIAAPEAVTPRFFSRFLSTWDLFRVRLVFYSLSTGLRATGFRTGLDGVFFFSCFFCFSFSSARWRAFSRRCCRRGRRRDFDLRNGEQEATPRALWRVTSRGRASRDRRESSWVGPRSVQLLPSRSCVRTWSPRRVSLGPPLRLQRITGSRGLRTIGRSASAGWGRRDDGERAVSGVPGQVPAAGRQTRQSARPGAGTGRPAQRPPPPRQLPTGADHASISLPAAHSQTAQILHHPPKLLVPSGKWQNKETKTVFFSFNSSLIFSTCAAFVVHLPWVLFFLTLIGFSRPTQCWMASSFLSEIWRDLTVVA